MLPFLKSLSSSLSSSKKSTDVSKVPEAEAESNAEISSLRRQSTHELLQESLANSRRSSRTNTGNSGKLSIQQKSSKQRSRTSLRNSVSGVSKEKSRKTSEIISKQTSLLRSASTRAKSVSNSQTDLTKAPSKASLHKNKSVNASNSLINIAKLPSKTSLQKSKSGDNAETRHSKLSNGNTTETKLWFPKAAILAVRTENANEFYLCRTWSNVYNYSREVKINWLTQGKKGIANTYKITYRDTIDPACILLEVSLNQLSSVTYQLPPDQLTEIQKLLKLAQDVETGKASLADVDDDVEEVHFIEEPVVKRARLQKTPSQRASDKIKRNARKKISSSSGTKKLAKVKCAQASKTERKRKSAPKKVADLELHPRPDIKVLELDPLFESREPMPYISKVANSRLVFRAIYLKDNKLLTKLLKDGNKIYQLYPKSLDNPHTPYHAAAQVQDMAVFQTILQEVCGTKFSERRSHNREDKTMINKLNTGNYNRRSLGIHFIRKITASRGSREGNNALTKTEDPIDYYDNDYAKGVTSFDLDPALLALVEKFFKDDKRNFYRDVFDPQDVHELLLKGKHQIAGKVIESYLKGYCRFFNHLYRDVLLFTTEELTGCSPSTIRFVSKKVYKLTPIHCAAANPNSKYLEKLLSVYADFNAVDAKGNRPIHFAAACSSSSNLKLLLEKGGNPNDTNGSRLIPLHYAVKANRPQNVELLLQEAQKNQTDPFAAQFGVGGVNRRDNYNKTPLHLAAEYQFVEVAEILLKYGADVNAKLNVSKNQTTPLMIAAAQGNLRMVRLLVQYGAVVEQRDRMERTAVTHACMNGATSVLSYLLNIGASGEHPDNSGNSPLHYAAAYGWFFTTKLLLQSGVNPNVSNMWKLTPVNIAYLKAQVGIMQELLCHDKVDINFTDDDGVTLIFHACSSDLTQKDLWDQIQYMIEEKGAICTLKDNEGRTPLHYLADAYVDSEESEVKAQAYKQSIAIAELLLKHGCDLHAVDKQGNTAVMIALTSVRNLPLYDFLLSKGCQILAPPAGDPSTSVLHEIAKHIWLDPANLDKLLNLIKKYKFTDVAKTMTRYVDCNGFTPLHLACRVISEGKTSNDPEIAVRKNLKAKWDNVRSFIKRLVDEFDADVNAKVQKKFFNEEDEPEVNSSLWWESQDTAGKTSAHIVMLKKDPLFDKDFNIIEPAQSGQIFKELVNRGADLNLVDEYGNTPLSTCIQSYQSSLFDFMADKGNCDFNQNIRSIVNEPDGEMVNPLMFASLRFENPVSYNEQQKKNETEMICKLIELGCDTKCVSKKNKQTFLHILTKQAHAGARENLLKIVRKLQEKKDFNFNTLDEKKRSVLHYAVMGNNGALNQSHELEVKFIQLGVNVGSADIYGRTALHYVFKKGKRYSANIWRTNETKDPVELVKLIGRNMSQEEINQQDRRGFTALHYAAQNGATMCCMYLTLVFLSVNLEDKDGNSALSLAVQNKHDGCATTLIQSGANLKSKVAVISSQELEKRKIQKKKLKENQADEEEAEKEIWKWKPALNVLKEESIKTLSLYQAAIENSLNGVAMFVTEADQSRSGLSELDAIVICIKSCKFNIALRLLCTTTNLSILTELREHERNLLHVLALSCENVAVNDAPVIIKIAEFLVLAGVSVKKPDMFNCSPILYAVLNRMFALADFLAEKDKGYNVNYTDGFKRSYLAAALWKCQSKGICGPTWNFLEKMIKNGININQHIDLPLNPEFASLVSGNNKLDPDYWQSYPDNKTTALIAAISCNCFTVSQSLLKLGADPNKTDGDDISPLMHAVIQGKVNHVKQILNYEFDPNKPEETKTAATKKVKNWNKKAAFKLKVTEESSESSEEEDEESMDEDEQNSDDDQKNPEFRPVKKTSNVNLAYKDNKGWTALHYTCRTHATGTFDNAEIAFVLVKAGAKLTVDFSGLNPYQLALKTGADNVANVLRMHFNLTQQNKKARTERDSHIKDNLPHSLKNVPDFKDAADKVLQVHDLNMDVDDTELHLVDSNCNIKNGELVKDEQLGLFYDVLLTKVDVKQGEWGLYNFYQIQLVFQPSKSLYILFTRWGRIEDKGQFQHTPFPDREQAVKEFMKIFREKSGNKWIDIKNFERKPNKYRLVEDNARKTQPPQKDLDIDLTSSTPSVLPKYVYQLIKTMMNPKEMQLSVNKTKCLNIQSQTFGNLNKETLLRGKELLEQIEKFVDKVEEFRSAPHSEVEKKELREAYQANLEKIAELSNEYFHLLPCKNFSYEKIRPLDKRQKLMGQMYSISNLLDYEVACKMLLAAMHFKTEYNPVDYVYASLGCQVEMMSQDDAMSQMILKYIYLTGPGYKVNSIYKVHRQGEEQRLKATGLGNRRLLWHGSNTCNLLSILNRGLLVAPPEARMSGWAYGKGIYLSDSFNKSASYVWSDSGNMYMLLCEVALGEIKDYYKEQRAGNAQKNSDKSYNSVVVQSHPYCFSPSDWFILPSGVSIAQNSSQASHITNSIMTEYIVSDPAQVCLRYLVQFKK
ncbi:poly [ADP-ribose] polymerase tankyrase-like [Physella acuta]|uniref:poly [ADP-ribose] polymerase tankyrase-like n=1 Tax=Physella acuta TaxID=109671 RepID=UPI0027DCBF94|nr:poly [ADP-ribose] polymerase tankyrase-like [Physella acuta]